MANPSFSIPDDTLEEFDQIILNKKAKGEIPMDTSRSKVIRDLVEEDVEGNENSSKMMAKTAD